MACRMAATTAFCSHMRFGTALPGGFERILKLHLLGRERYVSITFPCQAKR